MAISDQIEQLKEDVSAAYTEISDKGGTVPGDKNTNNLASSIDSIVVRPEPTGTIQITANGDYDVAQYANADVNVSGGGGGIPDKEFIQVADGSTYNVVSGGSSVAMQTPSNTDLYNIKLTLNESYGGYGHPGFPRGAAYVIAGYAGTEQYDYYSAFHTKGYAEGTIRIGNVDMHIKSPQPLMNYPNNPLSLLDGTTKINCAYTEFDFDHAIQGPLTYVKPYYGSTSTGSITVSVQMFFIPLITNDASIPANAQKKANDWRYVSYANIDTLGSTSGPIYNDGSNLRFDCSTGRFSSGESIRCDSIAERDNFEQNIIALLPCGMQNFGSSVTGLWAAVGITGMDPIARLQEFRNTIADTTKYPYGGYVPFPEIGDDEARYSGYTYQIFDPGDIAALQAEINTKPSSLSASVTAGDIYGDLQPVGKATRYLHEFVDHLQLGTILYTDYEQGIFDEPHVALYGSDDGFEFPNELYAENY